MLGERNLVERFIATQGLVSRELSVARVTSRLGNAGSVAQGRSELMANYGRWVKLTEESAKLYKHGTLMKGSQAGFGRAVLTKDGKITGLLEIVRSQGSIFANPAVLAGLGGIMAQYAMQQTMDEITDYLRTIDRKVDDVLRHQKNGVLADVVGVGLEIDEAIAIRDQVGRVSDVTWSKVQGSSAMLKRTQAYALNEVSDLAERIERQSAVGELADEIVQMRSEVQDWLSVLARCFQLQEALSVLELDRVLDATPDEVNAHRRGLKLARQKRLDAISFATHELIARIDAVAGEANRRMLWRPSSGRQIVGGRNSIADSVGALRVCVGVDEAHEQIETRRWMDAASDARDTVMEAGAEGFDAAKRFGSETFDNAKSVTGKLSSSATQRFSEWRRRDDGE